LVALPPDNHPQAIHSVRRRPVTHLGNPLSVVNDLIDVDMSDHRVPILLRRLNREKVS
jgi:hypothetical protein